MSEGKLTIRSRRADVADTRLDSGDTIAYRVSHQVEFEDRTQAWVGMEVTTSVRAAETPADTADRLVGFVHDQLHNRILQLVQENEHFTK
jgi:hypothetical protein